MDMDPAEAYTASLFKWDPRTVVPQHNRLLEAISGPPPPPQHPQTVAYGIMRPGPSREMCELEDLFQAYGIRFHTATKIAELGFTKHTLLGMKDVELDEMINSLTHHFKWELLVGEKYGIKAAIRAERKRFDEEDCRKRHGTFGDTTNVLDALSQEGLSEEPVQQGEVVGSGGGAMVWEAAAAAAARRQQRRRKCQRKVVNMENEEENEDDENVNERQREHPFIVTEPGEVARGKKNGLDYLFYLYEQCRAYLIQVQNIAKERGEKCPTKVTNQVFRFAKKEGATHINKPKMRHYVHCYALHCLDEEASNALRKLYKEKGENVGAWRQACYKPLVVIASRQGWDIDAVFNAHPRLSIWYVPTKLRQLCHAERSNANASSSVSGSAIDNLRF